MRDAAHRTVSGPASSDSLAAGGGLEVPAALASDDEDQHHRLDDTAASSLIPGARELDNLTHREPGAIGGNFNGSDIPVTHSELLDEADRVEAYREGGLDRKSATRKAKADEHERHDEGQ